MCNSNTAEEEKERCKKRVKNGREWRITWRYEGKEAMDPSWQKKVAELEAEGDDGDDGDVEKKWKEKERRSDEWNTKSSTENPNP